MTISGEAWVTGSNTDGQLGLGHYNNVTSWTKISQTEVKDITASGSATYLVLTDGTAKSTGRNKGCELDILPCTTAVLSEQKGTHLVL